MVKVRFIEHDGTEHVVEGAEGNSIMQTARDNLVPGIIGDCGGNCSCATCHVYVDREWIARLPHLHSDEAELLEMLTTYDKASSRLSCQVEFTPALDGIVLRVAPEE